MSDNETPADLTVAPPFVPKAKGESERTCILSGKKAPPEALIRLALGPDGSVAPDVRAKAPGRGAWIGVDRATLQEAIGKGRLAKALARAFKTAVTVPADLAEQIERALERATLDRLGLEARAGQIVTGTERIADAARGGTVALLLHARDAAADGTRKLDQALRVGLDMEGSSLRGLAIPATRAILSMALGRENVVHLALVAPAAAARVSEALGRWRGYIGPDDEP
ncbi:RNA-binding protein [Sphingomonas nostoxanthinifaciens]|uniref:RNA-binding protein n=1 Tax=Sphingomonas nostoxanthinifaciens TaxID=2872652 RepID=UPI001CC1F01C|nr:RNA-binding protein [Sphingomonas nostoxanthinifaciens]UAK25992.1 RNA-binding protein [Sphingomonas nostoxanthinifaciens]